ncbi:MAG: hypothetical protein GY865_20280, partial [candidate division Zixibacteria bacterium]|nr:hypothetical protein [candidate division Zixibacteria bacterium]
MAICGCTVPDFTPISESYILLSESKQVDDWAVSYKIAYIEHNLVSDSGIFIMSDRDAIYKNCDTLLFCCIQADIKEDIVLGKDHRIENIKVYINNDSLGQNLTISSIVDTIIKHRNEQNIIERLHLCENIKISDRLAK